MNQKIKSLIRKTDVKQWQVAAAMGVSEQTLIRWLRDDPMPEERRERIIQAIEAAKMKKGV